MWLGETSLVPEIVADANIVVFNTTHVVCIGGPDRDKGELKLAWGR
jgi:hypothetical protein